MLKVNVYPICFNLLSKLFINYKKVSVNVCDVNSNERAYIQKPTFSPLFMFNPHIIYKYFMLHNLGPCFKDYSKRFWLFLCVYFLLRFALGKSILMHVQNVSSHSSHVQNVSSHIRPIEAIVKANQWQHFYGILCLKEVSPLRK